MSTVSLSSAPMHFFSLHNNKHFLSLRSPPLPRQSKPFNVLHHSSTAALNLHPLRFWVSEKGKVKDTRRKSSVVCYVSSVTSTHSLQWISTISSVALMVAKGTAVQKSFIVPLFALQAPTSIISWIKGEYGIWAAFLALLVRLFFFIPGELELPYVASLLVIVAPHEVMKLRGTQEGTIISLVIAGYIAFQHFSRAGSLRNAFDQGSIVATLAVICITVVSCLFLI